MRVFAYSRDIQPDLMIKNEKRLKKTCNSECNAHLTQMMSQMYFESRGNTLSNLEIHLKLLMDAIFCILCLQNAMITNSFFIFQR